MNDVDRLLERIPLAVLRTAFRVMLIVTIAEVVGIVIVVWWKLWK